MKTKGKEFDDAVAAAAAEGRSFLTEYLQTMRALLGGVKKGLPARGLPAQV